MEWSFVCEPISPFRLDLTAWVLRRSADNLIDRWDGHTYRRVLVFAEKPFEVAVSQQGLPDLPRLQIDVTGNQPDQVGESIVVAALQRLLGFQIDLSGFYQFASSDPELKPLVERYRGFKPPRFETVFEALVNAIACQQITLTLGIRMLGRLATNFGLPFDGPAGTAYAFPRPKDLARLEPGALRELGFSHQKSIALIGLARELVDQRIDLNELQSLGDDQAVAFLRQLHGVGRWTAEYVLLRGLGRLEIFPGDDVGARNHLKDWLGLAVLNDYQGVKHALKPWESYGGMVYFHLLLKRLEEGGYLSS